MAQAGGQRHVVRYLAPPRVFPWGSWYEWLAACGAVEAVHAGGADPTALLATLRGWQQLGRVPLPVEVTCELLEARETAAAAGGGTGRARRPLEYTQRLALSSIITRFVSRLADSGQRGAVAASILTLTTGRLGLPRVLVDVRHEAAHGALPTLPCLTHAALLALQWLWVRYWAQQRDHLYSHVLALAAQLPPSPPPSALTMMVAADRAPVAAGEPQRVKLQQLHQAMCVSTAAALARFTGGPTAAGGGVAAVGKARPPASTSVGAAAVVAADSSAAAHQTLLLPSAVVARLLSMPHSHAHLVCAWSVPAPLAVPLAAGHDLASAAGASPAAVTLPSAKRRRIEPAVAGAAASVDGGLSPSHQSLSQEAATVAAHCCASVAAQALAIVLPRLVSSKREMRIVQQALAGAASVPITTSVLPPASTTQRGYRAAPGAAVSPLLTQQHAWLCSPLDQAFHWWRVSSRDALHHTHGSSSNAATSAGASIQWVLHNVFRPWMALVADVAVDTAGSGSSSSELHGLCVSLLSTVALASIPLGVAVCRLIMPALARAACAELHGIAVEVAGRLASVPVSAMQGGRAACAPALLHLAQLLAVDAATSGKASPPASGPARRASKTSTPRNPTSISDWLVTEGCSRWERTLAAKMQKQAPSPGATAGATTAPKPAQTAAGAGGGGVASVSAMAATSAAATVTRVIVEAPHCPPAAFLPLLLPLAYKACAAVCASASSAASLLLAEESAAGVAIGSLLAGSFGALQPQEVEASPLAPLCALSGLLCRWNEQQQQTAAAAAAAAGGVASTGSAGWLHANLSAVGLCCCPADCRIPAVATARGVGAVVAPVNIDSSVSSASGPGDSFDLDDIESLLVGSSDTAAPAAGAASAAPAAPVVSATPDVAKQGSSAGTDRRRPRWRQGSLADSHAGVVLFNPLL